MRALPPSLRSVRADDLPVRAGVESILDVAVRAVTPVLGGGVESFVPDTVDVVRVPSVRGSVRWWWRAMHPELNEGDLRKKERDLWGAVGERPDDNAASKVRVTVTVTKPGRSVSAGRHTARIGGGLSVLPEWTGGKEYGYALFPLQQPKDERDRWQRQGSSDLPTKHWRLDLEFRLRVEAAVRGGATLDEAQRREVRDAFSLWLTFGGYGARTRRGFGGLLAEGVRYDQARALLETRSSFSDASNGARPTLAGCTLLVGASMPTPEGAHRAMLLALQEFRQGTRFGRNPGQSHGRPGQSRWPEADSLRALAGQWEPRHKPIVDKGRVSAPRAAFGLPLMIQFKDQGDKPANATLVPVEEKTQRWASPVILRVVRRDDGFAPAVLILAGHRPSEVRRENASNKLPVRYTGAGARGVVHTELGKAHNDALRTFTDWLCSQWRYRQVIEGKP